MLGIHSYLPWIRSKSLFHDKLVSSLHMEWAASLRYQTLAEIWTHTQELMTDFFLGRGMHKPCNHSLPHNGIFTHVSFYYVSLWFLWVLSYLPPIPLCIVISTSHSFVYCHIYLPFLCVLSYLPPIPLCIVISTSYSFYVLVLCTSHFFVLGPMYLCDRFTEYNTTTLCMEYTICLKKSRAKNSFHPVDDHLRSAEDEKLLEQLQAERQGEHLPSISLVLKTKVDSSELPMRLTALIFTW